MGKKWNINKLSTHPNKQQTSISHPRNKKVEAESGQDSEIPPADVSLHSGDKKSHSSQEKGEKAMKNDQRLLEKQCGCFDDDDGQSNDRNESGNEKATKRKKKKERQKEKRLAKKMTTKRRDSEVSLGGFLDDDQELSSQTSKSVKVSLCRHPLTALEYFIREIPCLLCDVRKRCIDSRRRRNGDIISLLEILVIVLIASAVLTTAYFWITTNDPLSFQVKQYIIWYLYWVFLGILSSVGLGTGLHTFVLYLGPFIAKVSLAAQECSSLEFPMPPYPNQITCPSESIKGHVETPTIWAIANKVVCETLAWGFGTAIGELPPYFIARAASLTGDGSSMENLEDQVGLLAKVQLKMRNFVMKVGFWGILLCASIPNPLFDLAGITCGHFQVPFLVFFGATAIGKTIVKSQLQMIFVILAFNEKSLERVLKSVGSIPKFGPSLSKMFTDFMDYQRAALHNKDTSHLGGILKLLTEIIVIVMILYFVGSIINGMAQSYEKRIALKNKKRERRSSKAKKRLKAQT